MQFKKGIVEPSRLPIKLCLAKHLDLVVQMVTQQA